jgi:hypothetical protein
MGSILDGRSGLGEILRISSEIKNIMICGTDEFLLFLQNWLTESAKVTMLLVVFQEDPDTPMLAGTLVGQTASVDPTLPGFAFSPDEKSAFVINLNGWEIGFGADYTTPIRSVSRSFTLSSPGISVGLIIESDTAVDSK